MKTRMIFLGPPGAGKGTCASRVGSMAGIPQISTGDLLRNEIKEGTKAGMDAKKHMDSGGLVPDALVNEILEKRLAEDDCRKGFILDGYPRTISQAEALEAITPIDLVVNLRVSEDMVVARLSTRVTCRYCNEVYNTRTVPPKKEGVCDRCGGPLYQREDQKPEVVKDRLSVYRKETEPLIEHYRKKGLVYDVETKNIDEPPEVKVEKILKLMEDK